MHAPYDIRWLTDPPRPGRQYAFGRRGDRRRMAMRLAGGWKVEEVAAVERAHEGSLRELLRDDGFERLVAHYQELTAQGQDERLRRLTELAFAILTEALEAGDIRVAVFFMAQRLEGRNPAETVAASLLRALQRQAATPPPTPERRAESPRASSPARRREAEFPFCAATQPSPEAAEALAVTEASHLASRLAATATRLKSQLLNESEREGTITAAPAAGLPLAPADQTLPAAAATFARAAHEEAARAIPAAQRLQARWEGRAPHVPSPVAWERARVRASDSTDHALVKVEEKGPHPHPLPPSAGEGARGLAPPRFPDWLRTIPRDHLAYVARLPDHEVIPYLRRVAAMYSIAWSPPDTG